MPKEKFKPCSVSELIVGDVFTNNQKSRDSFIVTEVLSDKVNVKLRGKFQLHPTPVKKDKVVIFLRHEESN